MLFLVPDRNDDINKYIHNLRQAIPNPPPPTAFDTILDDFAERFGETTSKFLLTLLKFGLPFLVPLFVIFSMILIVQCVAKLACKKLQQRLSAENLVSVKVVDCHNAQSFIDVFPFQDSNDFEMK